MGRDEISQTLEMLRLQKSGAIELLLPLVYPELREMAHRALWRGARKGTLTTTALVHEAFLKLFDRSRLRWDDRRHFFAVAAIAMRQIVVDQARRRAAQKRGGGLERIDLDSSEIAVLAQSEDVLALHEALSRLALLDERLAQIVEYRFFAGLSIEEVAALMRLSVRTVKRDWRKAQAFLYHELTHGAGD